MAQWLMAPTIIRLRRRSSDRMAVAINNHGGSIATIDAIQALLFDAARLAK